MKLNKLITLLISIFLLPNLTTLSAQGVQIVQPSPSKKEEPRPVYSFDYVHDSYIVSALDSLANLRIFEGFECATQDELKKRFGFSPDYIPVYSDSTYAARMRELNASTTIPLTYNQYVRDYINVYAVRKRVLMQRVMGLAQLYFPLFEEHLDRFNMPLELKYLAIVESALNPVAQSPMGASGLWQFMYRTGRVYDLNVTSMVDDRRDPIKSTVAAVKHMNDLHKIYKDWLLVLAAYNSGAGNVNKAIRRSGGKMNYWDIRPYLPRETQGYVPAFIAVTYVMSYGPEHNLSPVNVRMNHYDIDTVMVNDMVDFAQLATNLRMSYDEILFLNPSYKTGVIPATTTTKYALVLNKKRIPDFVNNEDHIYAQSRLGNSSASASTFAYKPEPSYSSAPSEYSTTTVKAKYHVVKRGENLSKIASRYGTSLNNIKRWNGLRKNTLYAGQRLIVSPEQKKTVRVADSPKPKPNSTSYNAPSAGSSASPASTNPQRKLIVDSVSFAQADESDTEETVAEPTSARVKNVYHNVKRGETLGKIAGKYGVSQANLRSWNNLRGSTIHSGQRLIVNKTGATREILAKNEKPKPAGIKTYTVRSGDTLWNIARNSGVSVEDIKKLNNLGSESDIRPGQKLKVGEAS